MGGDSSRYQSSRLIDTDGDGSREAPLDYARRLVDKHRHSTGALIVRFRNDKSVTMHALHLLRAGGYDVASEDARSRFLDAPVTVRDGYRQYTEELGRSTR